jgi:hypothetical protein
MFSWAIRAQHRSASGMKGFDGGSKRPIWPERASGVDEALAAPELARVMVGDSASRQAPHRTTYATTEVGGPRRAICVRGEATTQPGLAGRRADVARARLRSRAATRRDRALRNRRCERIAARQGWRDRAAPRTEKLTANEAGGPRRTRTFDQGIHGLSAFPLSVDYLTTLSCKKGAGRSCLSSRALRRNRSAALR